MSTGQIKKFTVAICLVASQASLLFSFGYDACVLLMGVTTTMPEDLKMSEAQTAHFRDDAKILIFLACFVSGFMADFLGRRPTLVVSGVLASTGFLAMALASSYGLLITGRLVSLLGVGLGLPVAPLYVAEIAPPTRRGFLTTILEVLSVLGLWLAVLARTAVRDLPASYQWRVMVGVGIIPSLILGVGMMFLPESPCWLVRRARVADTKLALQRTMETTDEVETRLLGLREAARIPPTMGNVNFEAVAQDIQVKAIWQELRRPLVRPVLKKLLISVFTVQCLQQFSGIDLLTSESLLRYPLHSPVFDPMDYVMDQLLPLCGRFFPIFVPMFVSDAIGRTGLLSYSLAGAGFSLVFINVSLGAMNNEVNSRAIKLMNSWSVAAFFGSFSIGLGPMTTVHTSEALPFKIRAQVIGIALVVNRLVSVALFYLKPAIDLKLGLLFWILNFLFAFGMWLCSKFLIETSVEPLEDVDKDFSPTLELRLRPMASDG